MANSVPAGPARFDDSKTNPPETVSGFLISLLFWLSLVVSAALFGLVGMSPKLLEQARLRDEHARIQLRLVQIERQNEQLQRVVEAIGQDKDFEAELTRIEFDAIGKDEEVIPVDSRLRMSPRDIEITPSQVQRPQIWYRPLLIPFVENDLLRFRMLAAAAILVLVSFTWFQPSTARRIERPVGVVRSAWGSLCARYVRSN